MTSGTCGTNKTISLMYTPTKDANGTLLKCIVDNEHVPNIQELSSVLELKIIPGEMIFLNYICMHSIKIHKNTENNLVDLGIQERS